MPPRKKMGKRNRKAPKKQIEKLIKEGHICCLSEEKRKLPGPGWCRSKEICQLLCRVENCKNPREACVSGDGPNVAFWCCSEHKNDHEDKFLK